MLKKIAIMGAGLCFMYGCASITEGTSQEIAVNTSPAGADCALMREGVSVGKISPTPGAVTIKKTKHDMTIVCNKDGFHEATYFNKSDVAAATVGNVILGGGVGWIIDSASGADNKYTTPVNITMVPLTEPKPEPQSSKDDQTIGEDDEAAAGDPNND
jgi:hypothetical protein